MRESFQLLRLRHQERRRLVGTDDAWRMRVEGHHHGGDAAFAGDAAEAIEDLAVAAVQPVEISERQHRIPPSRRPRIVRKVNDVHD